MSKNRIIAAGIAALAGLTLLSGCTSSGPGNGSTSSPSATQTGLVASTPMPAETPSLTDRNLSFQDTGLGHSIKVVSFLNDLPLSDEDAAAFAGSIQGGSVVALHVSATAGIVLPTYIYDKDFQIQCAGMVVPTPPNKYFDADLDAAGYTPWVNPDRAENSDGWMTFTVAGIKNPTNCFLIYTRDATTGTDGKPIDAFQKNVELN
ncbi:MAG: hypothetical protein FWF36_09285 [Propionibacteriaceae bacterium]|nr:hypothetical protein [Propionibacteriaceae bacterium]